MKFNFNMSAMRYARTLCLPLLILGSVSVAHAQISAANDTNKPQASAQQPVQVHLTVHKVERINGKETLSEATQAAPGETLEYRAVYSNTGKVSVQGVLATLPLPPGSVYLANSAQPAKVTANTANNAVFAAVPLTRRMVAADGASKEAQVPYADYRGLQWQLGILKAGEQHTVVARVHIGALTTLR